MAQIYAIHNEQRIWVCGTFGSVKGSWSNYKTACKLGRSNILYDTMRDKGIEHFNCIWLQYSRAENREKLNQHVQKVIDAWREEGMYEIYHVLDKESLDYEDMRYKVSVSRFILRVL